MPRWAFPDRVQLGGLLLPYLSNDLAPRLLDACTKFVDPWLARLAQERGWRLRVCDVEPEDPCVWQVDLDKRLPWEDKWFGGVICSDTLEHIDHPAEAVKELHRITMPGGFLFLHLPVERAGTYTFAEQSQRIPNWQQHPHKHKWAPGLDAVTWATNAGYRLVGQATGYDDEHFRVNNLWMLIK